MTDSADLALPKPEIRGVGHVLYRCAACGELMEPEQAAMWGGNAFHPEHVEESDGR